MQTQKLKPILLVEDDRVDAMTIERALKDLNLEDALAHAIDGQDALAYLRNESNEEPCVILLDLNMPKMNGIEFLKAIKTDNELKKVPVVVLTTSREKRDIVESFNSGAAGYMVKPVDYTKFVETIRTIVLYWTSSKLPKEFINAKLKTNTAC